MYDTTFLIMNVIGLISFAAAGTVKAVRNKMDLFGVFVIGIINALGGGIVRDSLINKIPFAFTAYFDMTVASITVLISLIFYRFLKIQIGSKYLLLIPDAIGLAAFTTTGALIASEIELSIFGVIILSVTTAIGGGVSSDLLMGKTPLVLKDEYLYASCAVLGAIVFFAIDHFFSTQIYAAVSCIVFTLAIRIIAMIYNLKLPKIV